MNLAWNFSVQKRTPTESRGQLGSNSRRTRHSDGGGQVNANTTRRRATNNLSSTPVVPITERTAAESFAAVVLRIDAGTLAHAARRTKEAAKMWKAGRRCPNGSSLINMSSDIDVVWAWLQGEVEKRRAGSPSDAMAKLQLKAQMGDAEARAILAMINTKLS